MDLRGDVQQFLTGMRARLTPEQAGVTLFGGERRVPGLRREEVAQLAGVSTAYYTRMERGNLRGVSESVLRSLARILQMNDAETQHLFDLARAASEGARTPRVKPQSRLPQRAAQLIDAMPDVPTVALGRLSDPVGANALGRALFPHIFPADGEPLNHTRYLFLDDRSREFYADWERSAREVVSAMRLIAGRDPSDRALMALVGELATHSPEFRIWWAGHTVKTHTSGTNGSATPSSVNSPSPTKPSASTRPRTYGSSPTSPTRARPRLTRSTCSAAGSQPQERSRSRGVRRGSRPGRENSLVMWAESA
jgi:transcriptional regulator with XRE-family HTH domain